MMFSQTWQSSPGATEAKKQLHQNWCSAAFKLFITQKCQTFVSSSVVGFCFYLLTIFVSGLPFGFGLLVRHSKLLEDVTLGSRQLWWAGFIFHRWLLSHSRSQIWRKQIYQCGWTKTQTFFHLCLHSSSSSQSRIRGLFLEAVAQLFVYKRYV